MGDLRLPRGAGCIGSIIANLIFIILIIMGYPLLAIILVLITVIIIAFIDSK